MIEKIKALHIASFIGNVGDNANHYGFRQMMSEFVSKEIEYTEIEIREFYKLWNLRSFNSDDFINECNNHDLVIIGGGNFFELKWDYSNTGTTIDISIETLKKIRTPIFFNALGCDVEKGVSETTKNNFERFLDHITRSDQFFVSVRNDGSYQTLQTLYGDKFNLGIKHIADGAFYFKPEPVSYNGYFENRKFIGVNIASDMKDVRFNNLSFDSFILEFSNFLNEIIREYIEYDIIFFPHIHSDLEAINNVFKGIDDVFLRTRLIVAPYFLGAGAEEYIFEMYRNCDLIMGMRFHTNVCAIARDIPTLGLSSYRKIEFLYKELSLEDRYVNVNANGFRRELKSKFDESMIKLKDISKAYKILNFKLRDDGEQYFKTISEWYRRNI